MQNFEPAGAGVPQDGQRRSIALPHSMQNFAFGGFCAPHREQAVTHTFSRPLTTRATVRCITCESGARGD